MSAIRKTDSWLATHRATIGGSNAAAAVGLHPYKTPVALYYEMVLGQAEDLETNPDALRGILLEPIARQRLSDVLGLDVIPHPQDDFIHSTKYHWAHVLPDGFIVFEGENIPIELKVPSPENWHRLDAEIPDYIQCQCVHNAAVLAAPALMLACLNPVTMEIYRQLYEPKEDATNALMDAEQRYYDQYVVPRIPPPPQTHDDCKLRWQEHMPGKRLVATDEIEAAWSELVAVRATAKHAEERKEDLILIIKTALEDSEMLVDKWGNVLTTWKSHLQTALDSKRLKAARPEVWAEFSADKPIRTFLVKQPKGIRL